MYKYIRLCLPLANLGGRDGGGGIKADVSLILEGGGRLGGFITSALSPTVTPSLFTPPSDSTPFPWGGGATTSIIGCSFVELMTGARGPSVNFLEATAPFLSSSPVPLACCLPLFWWLSWLLLPAFEILKCWGRDSTYTQGGEWVNRVQRSPQMIQFTIYLYV